MNSNANKHKSKVLATVFFYIAMVAVLTVPGSAVSATLEHPERSVGYFIGDILVQRVTLDADEGSVISSELESGQRIDEYLYRLPVLPVAQPTWVNDQVRRLQRVWGAINNGSDKGDIRVDLRYQVINVPPVTQTISLPVMTLATDTGNSISIPAWEFTIGPLSRQTSQNKKNVVSDGNEGNSLIGNPQFLPDRSAIELLGTENQRKFRVRLFLSLILLFATLLMWFAWWAYRQYKDVRVLPFARARSTIGALPKSQRQSDILAWRALHAAFNETADKAISTGTVSDLLKRAPWLETARDEINNFYNASSERFFQQSDDARMVNIESLANSLYTLEKRQQRSSLKTVAPAQKPVAVKQVIKQKIDSHSSPASD